MMLTTKGRYAVMAIIDIEVNYRGSPVRLAEIASRQKIALNYLEQIFIKLKDVGMVKATRGPRGGYTLAVEARKIKISQVIDAVDEAIKMTRCLSGDSGCISEGAKCATHNLWNGLAHNIRSYLENISIADVIEGSIK